MSKYEAVYFVGDNQRLTESESILPKRGIEAHFQARLQPYLSLCFSCSTSFWTVGSYLPLPGGLQCRILTN